VTAKEEARRRRPVVVTRLRHFLFDVSARLALCRSLFGCSITAIVIVHSGQIRSDPIRSNPIIPCHPVVQSNRLATTITPRLGEAISATQSKAKAESRLGIHKAIGSQRSRQIVTHNGCFYQRNGFFWPAGLLDLGYWVFSFCFG